MSPNFYTVGPNYNAGNWGWSPQPSGGYQNNSYERYHSQDIYSGNVSEATRNWMIAGGVLGVAANLLGQNDPDTYRILSSAGQVANVVGGARMMNEVNQYHERSYDYVNQNSNWYNYPGNVSPGNYDYGWNSGWDNGWNGGWNNQRNNGWNSGWGNNSGWYENSQGSSGSWQSSPWGYSQENSSWQHQSSGSSWGGGWDNWNPNMTWQMNDRWGYNSGGAVSGCYPWLMSGPCF